MIAKAAVIGAGVIGAGWLARLCENGIDCAWYDPDPRAPMKLQEVLDNAFRAHGKLTMAPRPIYGAARRGSSIADAVSEADLVIEAVPERLDVKREVYREIQAANEGTRIASSTSGFKPSDLQADMVRPENLYVAHPFNPVYLLPLVELVAGARTDPAAIDEAAEFFAGLGMRPLIVRKEIDAFIADRLMEALWREALWLVHDDIATAEEIDDAIRFGCGLRWAQMGTFQVFDIAGGEQGMRHFMRQFGPALKWPWTKLTDVPEMDEALVEKIATQVEAQAAGRDFRALEQIRDDNLVAIMQALKVNNWGAGAVLAEYERGLWGRHGDEPDIADMRVRPLSEIARHPIRTLSRRVPPDWTDYNNHMNESRYLQAFADASDAMMRVIGADSAYVARGKSYFTVETHLRHLDEVAALEPIGIETRVLEGSGKKMHLWHEMRNLKTKTLLATAEHMLIHVSLETRAACAPEPAVAARLAEIAEAHARLPAPQGVGRAVGDPR
ncbi:MAG: carnitine 3-dehydrogenase [Pikeienuella sp.]